MCNVKYIVINGLSSPLQYFKENEWFPEIVSTKKLISSVKKKTTYFLHKKKSINKIINGSDIFY